MLAGEQNTAGSLNRLSATWPTVGVQRAAQWYGEASPLDRDQYT